MTNEQFQKLVIEKLTNLEVDVSGLKEDVSVLKEDVSVLKEDVSVLKEDVNGLKEGQSRLEKKLDAVYEQTAILTEFRTEANMKLDNILENNKSIHEVIGEHEVSIRTLRRKAI